MKKLPQLSCITYQNCLIKLTTRWWTDLFGSSVSPSSPPIIAIWCLNNILIIDIIFIDCHRNLFCFHILKEHMSQRLAIPRPIRRLNFEQINSHFPIRTDVWLKTEWNKCILKLVTRLKFYFYSSIFCFNFNFKFN